MGLPLLGLGYRKAVSSILGACACLVWGKPAAISWAAYGGTHMAGNRGWVASREQSASKWDLLSNSLWGTEIFQQPHEWAWRSLQAPPVHPSDEIAAWLSVWPQPHYRPWTRGTQLSQPWIADHRDCEMINAYCFKPLSFGVIWYSVIDN